MRKFNFTLLAAGALLLGGLAATAFTEQAPALVKATADVRPTEPSNVSPLFSITNDKPVITFTVTAPTKTAYDSDQTPPQTDLSETDLMTLTVYCKVEDDNYNTISDSKVIATFQNVKPGETVTVTDNDVQIGYTYSYNVIASIGSESSESWGGSGKVYAGIRPENAEDCKVTNNKGAAPVAISLTTPTLTSTGQTLEAPITKVILSRRNDTDWTAIEDIYTWENPAKGAVLTYNDQNVETGIAYSYFATVCTDMGSSNRSKVGETFLGEVAPAAPENVKAELTDAGAKITWDKVSEIGQDNGYVNPSNVVYDVYRYYSYDDVKLIQEGLSVVSFVDDLDDISAPTKLSWQIIARNEKGSSSNYYGISNELICGPAQPLPFEEYFNKDASEYAAKANNLWNAQAVEGTSLFYVGPSAYINQGYVFGVDKSEDTFDGLAYVSFDSYNYGISNYTSGSINIGTKKNLVASFYYYGVPESTSSLDFNVMNPDNESSVAQPLNLTSIKIGEVEEAGWQPMIAPIPYERYRTNLAIQFSAKAENNPKNTAVAIDNIIVREYPGVRNIESVVVLPYVKLSWVDPTPSAYGVLKEFRIYQYGPKDDDYQLIAVTEERPTYLAGPFTEDGTYFIRVMTVYDINGFEYEAEPTEESAFTITGVDTINADEIVSEEYFNLQGASIAEPAEGQVVIRKVVLTDGSVKAIKTVYKK